ncbi:hypothetical protein GL178_09650 [Vibrio toranzoniae]|uniref:GapS4a family protein n=1 Tax=Vibrio toranzoniae TaxID=1194427 RepID=UPI0013770646|nr:hypothetical protein [Vibrio toranzoniae]NAZ46504.1 hypothetical protein [Vibrio toranzoniae]
MEQQLVAGEQSKSSGETGETIVEQFFKKIGWTSANHNISFSCLNGKEHARKGSKKGKREIHGIDEHYPYVSGLESDTLINVLASVKHTKGAYFKSATETFKEHIEDLVTAIKCYQLAPINKESNAKFAGQTITSVRYIPVLFFLSSHKDETQTDFISRISSSRLLHDYDVPELYIVDNNKMHFILSALEHVKKQYSGWEIFFHHTTTSMNQMSFDKRSYSKILPVEYLGSPFIPFVMKKGEPGQEVFKFMTVTSEPFSGSGLSRYLYNAKVSTSDKAASIEISFPDYFVDEHLTEKNEALRVQGLAEPAVVVTNYVPNLRNLANEK